MLQSEAFLRLLLLLALAGDVAAGQTDRQQQFDEFTVRYQALPAIALEPRAAWAYGVTQQRNRGVLSLRITTRVDGSGEPTPVEANLKVLAKSAAGTVATVPMRQVTVDEAVIYIGEFDILDRESVTLDIAAMPTGLEKPLHLELHQKFFTW